MISASDIQELFGFQSDSSSVLSLYLERNNGLDFRRTVHSLLSRNAASSDGERVAAFVASEFNPGRCRGLAVFSSLAHGLWRVVPLPEPVNDMIHVGRRPFLEPLGNILDQYRRYGVALVDGEKARFHEVYLGQIEEYAPGAADADGKRNARLLPLLDKSRRHFKETADRLMAMARARGLDRIILGTTQELEQALISHLHSFLQSNLILDTQMNCETPAAEVLEKVVAGERQSRAVRESVLVHRLLDAVKADAVLGVIGLADTLNALEHGQVRLLLVRDGLAKIGRICPSCRHLSLNGKRCHSCYQTTEPLFNVVGEMIRLAHDLRCEVVRVLHDSQLDNFGGIGAELTFNSIPEQGGQALAAQPAPRLTEAKIKA